MKCVNFTEHLYTHSVSKTVYSIFRVVTTRVRTSWAAAGSNHPAILYLQLAQCLVIWVMFCYFLVVVVMGLTLAIRRIASKMSYLFILQK